VPLDRDNDDDGTPGLFLLRPGNRYRLLVRLQPTQGHALSKPVDITDGTDDTGPAPFEVRLDSQIPQVGARRADLPTTSGEASSIAEFQFNAPAARPNENAKEMGIWVELWQRRRLIQVLPIELKISHS